MAKYSNLGFVGFLAVLIIVFALYSRIPLSVTFDDSFVYNTGFDWQTSNNWEISTSGQAQSIIDASTGDWIWSLAGGQSVSLVSKKNFDTADATIMFSNVNDIRSVARNTYCSQDSAHVQIGSCDIAVKGGTTGAVYDPRNTVVQIINSKLDNVNFEVWVDGEKSCEGTGDRHIKISRSVNGDGVACNGVLRMKSARYRPLFGCSINDGESLGQTIFSAGNKVDINNFPVAIKRFCSAYPVFITSELKQGGDSTGQPYDILTRADSTGKPNVITIPDGETWQFSYIFNYREAGISIACTKDQAYNTNTKQCSNAKGIINFCTGQWNPSLNACVNVPEQKLVCSPFKIGNLEIQGTLKQVDSTTSQCEYLQTQNVPCKLGSYNPASQKCQFVPQNPPECNDADYIWNSATNVCEAFPIGTPIIFDCEGHGGATKTINGIKRCVFMPEPFYQCDAGFKAQKVEGKWSCVGIPQTTTPITQTSLSLINTITSFINGILKFLGLKQ